MGQYDNDKKVFNLLKKYMHYKRVGFTEQTWKPVFNTLKARLGELDIAYSNVKKSIVMKSPDYIDKLIAYNKIVDHISGDERVGTGRKREIVFDSKTNLQDFLILARGLKAMKDLERQKRMNSPYSDASSGDRQRMTDLEKEEALGIFIVSAQNGFLDEKMVKPRHDRPSRLRLWSEVTERASGMSYKDYILRIREEFPINIFKIIEDALDEELPQSNVGMGQIERAGHTMMTYAINSMIPCARADFTEDEWLEIVTGISNLSKIRPQGPRFQQTLDTHPLMVRLKPFFSKEELTLYSHPHLCSQKRFSSNAVIVGGGLSLNAVALREMSTNQSLNLMTKYSQIYDFALDSNILHMIHLFLLYEQSELSKTRTSQRIAVRDIKVSVEGASLDDLKIAEAASKGPECGLEEGFFHRRESIQF